MSFFAVVERVGKSRGGDEDIGGVVWEDISEMRASPLATDIPQVTGHNNAKGDESSIRIDKDMRLINIDAGLLSCYGGRRAFIELKGDSVIVHEKVKAQKQSEPDFWSKTSLKDQI